MKQVICDDVAVALNDGQSMLLRRWAPPTKSQHAVVALHGLMTHSGWFHAMGECLAKSGITLLALDRRGSGRHRGLKGLGDGEAWLDDIARVLDFARSSAGLASLFCWCGGVAPGVVAASRYPQLHRLILSAPALFFQDGIRGRMGEWSANSDAELPLPFDPLDDFSDLPTVRMYIDQDVLRWQRVPRAFIGPGLGLRNTALEVLPRITTPVRTFLATRDTLIDNTATRQLVASKGEVREIDGCHAIVIEQPQIMAREVALFLNQAA